MQSVYKIADAIFIIYKDLLKISMMDRDHEKNHPISIIVNGIMNSKVFVPLIFEETSKEVCTRSNRTEVQTTRQFIRS